MQRRFLLAMLVLALAVLPGSSHAQAQAGGGYTLSGWVVAGGGGSSTVSDLILTGTAGQPEAGPVLRGGGYTLAGGFWGGGGDQHSVYLPIVIR